jgi:hypothetical protein
MALDLWDILYTHNLSTFYVDAHPSGSNAVWTYR